MARERQRCIGLLTELLRLYVCGLELCSFAPSKVKLVSCLRSSLHNLIVIPGKLALASATRNPGKSKASGFPLPRE
jgi:hypothetical protein